jgi:creatinine amidohydrolase
VTDFERFQAVLWQKQRRDQVAEAARRGGVAVLPTGAIEQHGPHLPLDTDSWSSFAIAARAAAQVERVPVLVLPPLWWGLSPYWMVFPGTLTLRPETLLELIFDLSRSVAHHGFKKLLILNGHGGNDGLIQAAAIKCQTDELRVAAVSYWSLVPAELRELAPRDGGSIGHAGQAETSIQLELQPECVRLEAVRPEQCLDLTSEAGRASEGVVYSPPDPRRESPHGVYGLATEGSRERGEGIVQAAARALAEYLERFAEG